MQEFRRAVYGWNGDDSVQFYQLLSDRFQTLTLAQRKELEPSILNIIEYSSNTEKYKVALSFLRNTDEYHAGIAPHAVCMARKSTAALPYVYKAATVAVVWKPLSYELLRTTNTYRNGQDYDFNTDAIAHCGKLDSYYHNPCTKSKESAFVRQLKCGLALTYFFDSEHCSMQTPAQYKLIMSVLHWLLVQNYTQCKSLGLSLTDANGVSNINGSPKRHIKLHVGSRILADFFAAKGTIPLLAKIPEIAQMAAYFKTGLDCLNGLSAPALIDMVMHAKHHTRSGIIVPAYAIGVDCCGVQVLFRRVALYFAGGIFEGNRFEVLPFQKELYEELRLKYWSIKDAKGDIGGSFNDPKFCGKYDHCDPPDHERQRWMHMPNKGKPLDFCV